MLNLFKTLRIWYTLKVNLNGRDKQMKLTIGLGVAVLAVGIYTHVQNESYKTMPTVQTTQLEELKVKVQKQQQEALTVTAQTNTTQTNMTKTSDEWKSEIQKLITGLFTWKNGKEYDHIRNIAQLYGPFVSGLFAENKKIDMGDGTTTSFIDVNEIKSNVNHLTIVPVSPTKFGASVEYQLYKDPGELRLPNKKVEHLYIEFDISNGAISGMKMLEL